MHECKALASSAERLSKNSKSDKTSIQRGELRHMMVWWCCCCVLLLFSEDLLNCGTVGIVFKGILAAVGVFNIFHPPQLRACEWNDNFCLKWVIAYFLNSNVPQSPLNVAISSLHVRTLQNDHYLSMLITLNLICDYVWFAYIRKIHECRVNIEACWDLFELCTLLVATKKHKSGWKSDDDSGQLFF